VTRECWGMCQTSLFEFWVVRWHSLTHTVLLIDLSSCRCLCLQAALKKYYRYQRKSCFFTFFCKFKCSFITTSNFPFAKVVNSAIYLKEKKFIYPIQRSPLCFAENTARETIVNKRACLSTFSLSLMLWLNVTEECLLEIFLSYSNICGCGL
jgi:hypothetical protein